MYTMKNRFQVSSMTQSSWFCKARSQSPDPEPKTKNAGVALWRWGVVKLLWCVHVSFKHVRGLRNSQVSHDVTFDMSLPMCLHCFHCCSRGSSYGNRQTWVGQSLGVYAGNWYSFIQCLKQTRNTSETSWGCGVFFCRWCHHPTKQLQKSMSLTIFFRLFAILRGEEFPKRDLVLRPSGNKGSDGYVS